MRSFESVSHNSPSNPLLIALTVVLGLMTAWPSTAQKRTTVPEGGIKTDDLMIVDCLLPGQVRQLGGEFTYLSARRPIRTSAKDCAIRGGEYVAFDRANYGTALKVWLPPANQGDANAMNYVGEIYEKGLGTAPDFALARSWYEKAAMKGNSSAMINLGSLYERGVDGEKDMVKAMNWYRKASGLKDSDLEIVTETERAERIARAEELERLRLEASTLKSQLAEARSQLSAVQGELAANQSALSAARQRVAKLQASSAEAIAAKAKIAELEASIAQQKEKVDTLQGAAGEALVGLGLDPNQRGPAPNGTKPMINVITPKLAMTRAGVLAAPLLTRVNTYQVIGRVFPSEGLRALRVNDQDVRAKIDADGIFEINVSVANGDTPVAIEAVAQDGLSTTESFILSTEQQAQTQAQRVTSRLFAKRMRGDLGEYHALVIGNNRYSAFPALSTAVSDATEISKILSTRYGFRVKTVIDGGRAQIISALSELTGKLKKSDNLLIYFAGHGQIDAMGKGYWVPVDGQQSNPATWVGNDTVTDFLGAMQAKHVLVVADSCYSGTLSGRAVRPLAATAKDDDILAISRVKARTVLSSGGLAPVLDKDGGSHSIFASAFIRALNSSEGLVEGARLSEQLTTQVLQRSTAARLPQRPQYSALKHAGHEGSEFFFLPKDA
jgi:uncharacterized caspase-like protein